MKIAEVETPPEKLTISKENKINDNLNEGQSPYSIVNQCVIYGKPTTIFKVCTDVEDWPNLFESCTKVVSESIGDNEIVMEMTVETPNGENTIRSYRKYCPEVCSIDFDLHMVPDVMGKMTGKWQILACEDEDSHTLTVSHNYFPPASIATKDHNDFAKNVLAGIYDNTEVALSAIKRVVEK